jgi:23S rRNA pseudouridine1911/1915/1917 synthase
MPSWIVSSPDRLDAFLASEGAFASRSQAQKAIETGLVRVNDEVVTKPSQRIQEGDKVEVTGELALPESDIAAVDLHLSILYEDATCLVINKPTGYAVHPGAGMFPGEKTILHGVAHLFAERSLPFSASAVLVHRLDKDTTGCLLIAKSPADHVALQKQFEERSVDKRYLAIVAGVPSVTKAMVDSPIGRSTTDRTRMAVHAAGAPREAKTTYEVLAKGDRCSLLLCELHTGRTHQIRVHLHALGHPVLGDGTYGSELADRLRDEKTIKGLCLHAWKLAFASPADNKEHKVIAPLPQDFLENLERCGIEWTP